MIGDNNLHVQHWIPNFVADEAKIDKLIAWVRIPVLLVEYYTRTWLERTWNLIGKTLKVDNMTLVASRGKFSRVCAVVAGYLLKGKTRKPQYEGLNNLCFSCGRYDHDFSSCPGLVGGRNQTAHELLLS